MVDYDYSQLKTKNCYVAALQKCNVGQCWPHPLMILLIVDFFKKREFVPHMGRFLFWRYVVRGESI